MGTLKTSQIRANLEYNKTVPTKPSVADLTIRDVFHLAKTGIIGEFVSVLIFGLPYALVYGLGTSVESAQTPQWVKEVLWWGAVLLFCMWLLPDLLAYLGALAIQWSTTYKKSSLPKRFLLLSLLVACLFLLPRIPGYVWFAFFVFVLVPASLVLDEYHKLLKEKLSAWNEVKEKTG